VAELGDNGAWWTEYLFSPVDVFRDILARRRAYEATVTAEQKRNKSVAALTWPHDLPDCPGDLDFAALRKLAGIATPDGVPVVSDALTVARLLGWLVAVWAETEDVKGRRSYVRAKHGTADPLPPSWLSAVRNAAGTRMAS
jgi:hypothetical protein